MPDGAANQGGALDTGLSCLVLLLRFLNVPADADQIRHEHGKRDGLFDCDDLIRCAKRAGALARQVKTSWDQLDRAPLPAIAALKDGEFAVLGRVVRDQEGEKILCQHPRSPAPTLIGKEEFLENWSGSLILMTHREALSGPRRHFGLSWFIPVVVRYRKLFMEVLIASFFVQLMGLVGPLFFQVVTDKVLVHRGLSSLDVLALGLALVSLFEILLNGARTYVFSHTTSRIDVELGARLFHHLMGLPMAYFATRQAGITVARVRELENIRSFLTGSSLTLVVDSCFTVIFFFVMFLYSPQLTWIVLATIPLYVFLSLFVSPSLKKRIDQRFQHGAANQAFLVESVTAAETCKAMALEPQMQRKWEDLLAAYIHSGFQAQTLNNFASQVAQAISKAQLVLLLWLGARAVMDGDMTIGSLVAFNMLAGHVASPILRLAQLWQDFMQMRVSVDRLGDILNTPVERSEKALATLPPLRGKVSFDKVTFRYGAGLSPVLHDVSLEVSMGESIGIVGSSGSGKSTLTKLIQRLYLPESGRVTIDGIDLALADTAWLRRQVGVVLQENVLFTRSIRDNIALADPAAPMDAVIQAAKLASAHDFILELPEAYNAPVVERGANLSGGQRQRIAIARALLTNPRILIFDEATSALDYESEAEIRRNMAAISQGRTVFIVAHRLSAVRHCDRIVVMERGRIVEQGKHDVLLASGGRYANLWKCQEAGYVPA